MCKMCKSYYRPTTTDIQQPFFRLHYAIVLRGKILLPVTTVFIGNR